MKQHIFFSIICVLFFTSSLISQNPLLDNDNSNNNSPTRVGGSIAVDVNTLVSNEDAQKLLDNLGAVTVQLPVRSYYANAKDDLVKFVKKGAIKGLWKYATSGKSLSLGLTKTGKELLINTKTVRGVEVWYMAVGLCKKPIVNYTSLGTSSGKPGQTLNFSLNIDWNTTVGTLLNFTSSNRMDFKLDLIPTSSGWIIDQSSASVPIKQASASNIGVKMEKWYNFCEELPTRLVGKTWTRKHKKESKRDRYTFKADGTCSYYNAKKEKKKTGTYSVSTNKININFLDGDNIEIIVGYENFGDNWLIMVRGIVWSANSWKFYSTEIK